MRRSQVVDKLRQLPQRISDWSLARLLAVNDYHIAAGFLFFLWVGARADPNNGVFLAIQALVPLFTPLWWEVTFALCALVMAVNRVGRWEDAVSMIFFIFPVTTFFSFLVVLTIANRARPTPYFIVMLIVACIFVIDAFVVRTRAMNYMTEQIVALRLELNRSREQVRQLEESKQAAPDSSSEEARAP